MLIFGISEFLVYFYLNLNGCFFPNAKALCYNLVDFFVYRLENVFLELLACMTDA